MHSGLGEREVDAAATAAVGATAASGSLRHAVLAAARRFKSGWAELGKLLVQVRDQALYAQWGYPSFEVYCAKEIRIRQSTAEKLTRSFSFLARHEPQSSVDRRDWVAEAPPFEVVEVLADAEERNQLSDREYREVRDAIWSPDRPVAQLRRELTERFPQPETPRGDGWEEAELARLVAGAKRLAEGLRGCRKVPREMAQRGRALAEELEALLSERRGSASRR